MITIAWYNVVAIIAGVIAFGCAFLIPKDEGGMLGGVATALGGCIWFFLVVLFYAIWGGIFWW